MTSLIHKTLVSTLHLHPRIHFSLNSTTRSATRSMSSTVSTTQRMFQLKLDPLTGNSEWVVIEEEDDEFSENPQKPLLATTSYLDMLNDTRRNRAFREAIEKTVNKPCHVLDIGAGTGLLSMIAARAMSSSHSTEGTCTKGMVTACESYLPMVKLMRKVMRLNGMDRKIKVFNKRSDELKVGVDIPSRADILVSEILDSELLGEGLIPTLQHAHDMLLVENAETVPYLATTYGQLVESPFLWKLHDLYNNEVQALDGIHIVPTGLENILCAKQQQYAMHCDAIEEEIRLLSEPFKIFEFDFWKRPDSHGETELRIKATNDGRVNAVVSWWVLQLDREGTIFYSTAPKWISLPYNTSDMQTPIPGSRDWCDHWKQCVWFIPGKGLSISKDEEVHFHAKHTETSILYDIETQARRTNNGQHHNNDRGQLMLSPERVAIYGDSEWRHSMIMAVKKALQDKDFSLCVVADDSVFLTILAAHLSQKLRVISLFPGLRDKGAQYLHAVAQANGFSTDCVVVLEKRKTRLTKHDTYQKEVDLLIGEPFYHGYDGGLPWQNLRFWKERTMLDSILSKDVVIMPCKGILKGCAMSLPDLWNSRNCLEKIEGFDHSVVNSTLGAGGNSPDLQEKPCLPFFIWQCGEIKELSKIFTVMEFDFLKPISPCSGKAKVEYTKPGMCHGLVFWIDWVIDAENSNIISTGPDHRYWKQAVKLLDRPMVVDNHRSSTEVENCPKTIDASFDPSTDYVQLPSRVIYMGQNRGTVFAPFYTISEDHRILQDQRSPRMLDVLSRLVDVFEFQCAI